MEPKSTSCLGKVKHLCRRGDQIGQMHETVTEGLDNDVGNRETQVLKFSLPRFECDLRKIGNCKYENSLKIF